MPVIGIQTDLLQRCLGESVPRKTLLTHLEHLGCDVEGFASLRRFQCRRCENIVEITETQDPPLLCDRCGVDFLDHPQARVERGEVDVIRMDLLAVRPDMFDPGGLGRVMRAYLGRAPGLVTYPVAPPELIVQVSPDMATRLCPRPAIACAVVRGLHLDDDLVRVVMKLQESLHWALGRDRKHASIGVYDLDSIRTDAPLRYGPVQPEGRPFVPLGYDPEQPGACIPPARVLAEHPKGQAYAHLLEGWAAYPLLEDAAGTVLSMPPIINSEDTRVREGTRNFFIDVTGSGHRVVSKTLNVLVTSLLELAPGARLEAVEVRYPQETLVTPDLSPQPMVLDTAATTRLLGLSLTRTHIAELLERMGHDTEQSTDRSLRVSVPAWRNDVLHPRDLMEDVAIAYGYHNIHPSLVPTFTVGRPLPLEERSGLARQALTGLGYQEVMTLPLSSPRATFDAMRLPRNDQYVSIENPISVDQTMVRASLVPGLLQTLAINTHRELPQRIFEVSDVTFLDSQADTGTRELRQVAGALIDSTAGFADIRPVVQAVLREFGWSLATEPANPGSFLEGRGARIIAVRGAEGTRRKVGSMGELHPEVLEAFKLRHPAAVFEMDLARLF